MSKIVFIEPKSPNLHIYSQFKLPRLGVFILGTLMKNRGWEVEVICEEFQALDYAGLANADLVGISTITSTAPRAYKIADKLRQAWIPVIMGGAHVTFLPDEALSHADFVIRGEGETALMAFIDAWEQHRDFSRVPNLSYKLQNEIIHNPMGVAIDDLDTIPLSDFSGLAYKPGRVAGLATIPVLTSRGCPYECAFCSVTGLFGRKYRFRSSRNIIAELKRYDQRRNHIFFYDDNFAADKKRLLILLQDMIQAGFRFTWSAQVRADLVKDEALVKLMRRAGCRILYIGLESVNPASLRAVKKRQTVQEIESAVRILRKHRIRVHGMFVLGFDDDDWQTVKKTVKFAKRSGLTSSQFLILTPLPGSEFYRKIVEEKRLLFPDWSLFDAHHVVFQPANFSLFTLQRAQIISHKKFYSWIRTFKRLIQGKWLELGLARYARNLNRVWQKKNRSFIRMVGLLADTQNANIRIDYTQKINLD